MFSREKLPPPPQDVETSCLAHAVNVCPLSFGDILYRKQDQMRPAARLFDSPGIEDQDSMTDPREIMLDPKILKKTFLGYDLFEKFPQLRNVPLTTTRFVNRDPLGFLPGNPEGLIESLVARDNPRTAIEPHQRFSNGFDNAFSILSGILGKLLNAFYFSNIYNVNHNPIDYIIDCAVGEHPD